MARTCRSLSGRACLLYPGTSDLNLFRYGEGIIHFDSEISDGALDLGVAEQKLHGPQIASAPVNQCRLCPPERMGAEKLRVQSNAGDPLGDESCILAGRHALAHAAPAGE